MSTITISPEPDNEEELVALIASRMADGYQQLIYETVSGKYVAVRISLAFLGESATVLPLPDVQTIEQMKQLIGDIGSSVASH